MWRIGSNDNRQIHQSNAWAAGILLSGAGGQKQHRLPQLPDVPDRPARPDKKEKDIGKTVFLTRKEAESALERMEGEEK